MTSEPKAGLALDLSMPAVMVISPNIAGPKTFTSYGSAIGWQNFILRGKMDIDLPQVFSDRSYSKGELELKAMMSRIDKLAREIDVQLAKRDHMISALSNSDNANDRQTGAPV